RFGGDGRHERRRGCAGSRRHFLGHVGQRASGGVWRIDSAAAAVWWCWPIEPSGRRTFRGLQRTAAVTLKPVRCWLN
ncbi:unnamed protein product, partial [Ectocarpus sp. 12 AP-2014]